MIFNLANIFKPKTTDTLIFQVSEEFIEVAAVRRLEADATLGGDATDALCHTELLYSARMPRVVPAKKTLDDLAVNMGKLADTAIKSKELQRAGFVIAEAKVACILVEPLSREALVTYSATLKKQTKITNKLLMNVLSDGKIAHDELATVPPEYAVYSEEIGAIELNGYSTRRPLNKEAKRLSITIAKHLTTGELWSATGGVLERTFNREMRYMHKSAIIELSSPQLCDEIYTGTELQEVRSAIL